MLGTLGRVPNLPRPLIVLGTLGRVPNLPRARRLHPNGYDGSHARRDAGAGAARAALYRRGLLPGLVASAFSRGHPRGGARGLPAPSEARVLLVLRVAAVSDRGVALCATRPARRCAADHALEAAHAREHDARVDLAGQPRRRDGRAALARLEARAVNAHAKLVPLRLECWGRL